MENAAKNGISYEFGDFRLDTAQRVVFRAGRPVPLAPKVLETLVALVERNGDLVPKAELMERLWPDTFVEESNLTQNVFQLRKLLGEAPDGTSYIETVPRRGYRFRGDVKRAVANDGLELILANRTRTHIVHEEETTEESGGPAESEKNITADSPPQRESTPRRLLIPIAVVTPLLIAGAIVLSIRQFRGREVSASTSAIELKRLTYDSKAFDPAVSPNGEFVAYRFHEGTQDSIKLKNIRNGSTVSIMPPNNEGYDNLVFSPDGSYLYFMTQRPGVKNGVIARIPVFGGTPQYLVEEVWGPFALSPDGREFAFFRGSENEMRLLVTNLDGSGERELIRSKGGELWFVVWDSGPSWSPDGSRIAVFAGKNSDTGPYNFLLEVPVDGGGPAKEMPAIHWHQGSQVAWLPDASGLVVVAQEKAGTPYQVWLVSFPAGAVRRLTNDLLDYDKLSVSADGRLLLIQQETIVTHIWVAPAGDALDTRQLTFGAADRDGRGGLAWTPDDHLVYASARSGTYDIWIMNGDGTNARQLTADTGGSNWRPRATPDGRYIVFTSNRGGKQNIWRMNADGSNPTRMTTGEVEAAPWVSFDGQWLYYTNVAVAPSAIERIPFGGGPATKVSSRYSSGEPVVSPDGKVAYEHYDDHRGWHTAILRAESGEPLTVFDWHAFRGGVRWTPDSQALIYSDARSADNLWRQPIDGHPPQQLTFFKEDRIDYFDLSPDGKQIAMARGNSDSDIVLITNFH